MESATQANFIHNIYVKNDVFESFYEDYLEYKAYFIDILVKNQIITKPSRRSEKGKYVQVGTSIW